MSGRVVTIPAGTPFLAALAEGLVAEARHEPAGLAGMRVLLPTRRACRALTLAFAALAGERPLLLPRLLPIGDVDADELVVADAVGLDLPPPLDPWRRQLLLSRLVAAWRPAGGPAPTPQQAHRMAQALGRLIDDALIEQVPLERLRGLAPEPLAAHWQETLRFLAIVTEAWPRVLEEEGAIDAAEHRTRLALAQASHWEASPPPGPVVVAGSTGSIPATAALIARVAALLRGLVVLPGLDLELEAESWAALGPGHPQWALARLLERLKVGREGVAPWPAEAVVADPARAARRQLWREALRPAATVAAWRDLPGRIDLDAATRGLERVDCASPEEEAAVIALSLREALETPGRTAALVTPDRALARRVAAALQRWGLEVDDSAGLPLDRCGLGVFLLSLLEVVEQAAAPVPLLALLKHRLAAVGFTPLDCRRNIQRIERRLLRGPRPAPGLEALRRGIDALAERAAAPLDEATAGELVDFLDRVEAALAPLADLVGAEGRGEAEPAALLAAFIAAAEGIAAASRPDGTRIEGARRLWREEEGEAAWHLFTTLGEALAGLPPLPFAVFVTLMREALAGTVVRRPWGTHPRLAIWGPLEARLMSADLILLGGLNEGTWPAEPEADPWMSWAMRAAIGLAPPEREIGRAAHDLAQLGAAPRVILTRALRSGGSATLPARWLARLDAVLVAAGGGPALLTGGAADRLALARGLARSDTVAACARPAPTPPVAARPRRLSVTQVETWIRDPYAIYARHVLQLRPLEPVDSPPDARALGDLLHDVLEAWARAFPDHVPPEGAAWLEDRAEAALASLHDRPEVAAFWRPRLARALGWFLERQQAQVSGASILAVEISGDRRFDHPVLPFTLTAKADRIDRRGDGSLEILDYKSGRVPSAKEVAAGLAPQLPLEALIAESGGFPGIAAAPVSRLAYWRLSGQPRRPGEERAFEDAVEDLKAEADRGLARLVGRFADPAMPYVAQARPRPVGWTGDYDHLERIAEWSVAEAAGEEA